MATDELQAGMPDLESLEGMTYKFEAIDATTGATVNGVTITEATIYGDVPDAEEQPSVVPAPPLWAYVPLNGTG